MNTLAKLMTSSQHITKYAPSKVVAQLCLEATSQRCLSNLSF